jgi:hypothetical protein
MNDITFKIAKKGEGKTKWLLDIANQYSISNKIYLYTDEDNEYIKFCEKYFNMYNSICPVQRLTSFDSMQDAIVLVDNIFNQDSSVRDFIFIQRNCYKLFITLEGELANA